MARQRFDELLAQLEPLLRELLDELRAERKRREAANR